MSLFSKLTTAGLETSGDSLGGRKLYETDIYPAKIKAAYVNMSDGGAMGITMIFDIAGSEYQETAYVTNKKGENFYTVQGQDKKHPLPGFTLVNDICLITTGTPLSEQDTDEKVVKKYDKDAKKELPTQVAMLTGLIEEEVHLAIVKQIVNKTTKDDSGEYVATGETKEENTIEKVFHPTLFLTVTEATNEVEASFYEAWKEKNKGTVKDKTKKDAGTKAASKGSAAAPSERKSLFGKK